MRATTLEIAADRSQAGRRGSPSGPARRLPSWGTAAAAAIALVTIGQLLSPSNADASLNPLGPVEAGINAITGGVGGLGANLAVKGFVAILNSLFSGFEAHITLQILTWLTSSANQTGGNIAGLYSLTSGIAIGLLGAVLTASFVRYWLAGLSLSGRGGYEALEGLLRTLAAVAGLLCWPFLFDQLVALGNICSATVLGSPALRGNVAHLINTVVFVTFQPNGKLGLFVTGVLAFAGALLFVGLLFMKVMTGAALTFLYVAMPIAIILWPVEELAWLSRHAARTFLALVLIPVIWALIFATFAAISVNALEFQGASGFVNQVTQPLVAIAMLWLTVTIPRTLFRLATSGIGLGRHGGGFISHAGSFLAARQAGEFLAEQGLLPFGRGGFMSQGRSEGGPASEFDEWPNGGDGGAVDDALVGQEGSESGAAAAGEFVEELAAGAVAGPAGAAVAAGVAVASAATDAAAGGGIGAEQLVDSQNTEVPSGDGESPASATPTVAEASADVAAQHVPDGQELAAGPSIGKYRPQRDHDNPLATRPSDRDEHRPALEAALARARELPSPALDATHNAFRSLHPDVQAHLQQAYDSSGGENANAVRLEAARLSTSDLISNAQSQDLMMVARAAEHGQAHWVLGREAPGQDASPPPPPGPGSSVPATSPSTPAPPVSSASTGEQSPHAAERDEAWRKAGPSTQPHTD